ncbi:response regulator transcription factor [Vallitalea maricola]|uniref:Response regulator transcription factor n=1 Tax=Vallitalea maricola TaxID=3074433 RepID=A0ACB5UDZ4_9FIRM|nr:response regulator transcription factor [Vallitalea sp. AN17-2]
MKTILIIDDDVELCNLLKECLESDGYQVTLLHTGEKICELLEENKFNLIILDVMLPKINGLEILKEVRNISNVPVLMLSAKSNEMDKVLGLKIGADDYLTKPFGLSELIARVNSLIRRFTMLGGDNSTQCLREYGKLKIDTMKCIVTKCDIVLSLTAKEYKLLCFLSEHPNQVFTKKQIYQNVWEEEYIYDDNTIMALIRRLRKKIEDDPANPQWIQNVWGIGYRFCEEVN